MDKVNQYAFYEFGDKLGRLRELNAGADLGDYFFACMAAETAVSKFLLDTVRVPLKLSKTSAMKLWETLTGITGTMTDEN
jgi:hypothetical protein